jgi:hypothetical protein
MAKTTENTLAYLLDWSLVNSPAMQKATPMERNSAGGKEVDLVTLLVPWMVFQSDSSMASWTDLSKDVSMAEQMERN